MKIDSIFPFQFSVGRFENIKNILESDTMALESFQKTRTHKLNNRVYTCVCGVL